MERTRTLAREHHRRPRGSLARGGTALEGPCAAQTATLALTHSTPDSELLPVVEGVFETLVAYDAAPTDFLRLSGRRSAFGEKQIGIDAHAVCAGLPATI